MLWIGAQSIAPQDAQRPLQLPDSKRTSSYRERVLVRRMLPRSFCDEGLLVGVPSFAVYTVPLRKPKIALAHSPQYAYIARSFLDKIHYATSKRHQNQKVRCQAVQDHRFWQGSSVLCRPASPLPDQESETPPQPARHHHGAFDGRISHQTKPAFHPLSGSESSKHFNNYFPCELQTPQLHASAAPE